MCLCLCLCAAIISCDMCMYVISFVCLFDHPQGTPERLIMHLVEEPSVVDPTYIEDFLLTYRTFLSNPMEVGKKLLEWFQVDTLRDTVSLLAFVVVFLARCVEQQYVYAPRLFVFF